MKFACMPKQGISMVLVKSKYRSLGKIHCWIFSCEIVLGKIFSSLGISDEKFLTMNYFKIKLCSVAHEPNA